MYQAAAVLLHYRVYQPLVVYEQQGLVAAGAVQKQLQPLWLPLDLTLPALAPAPPHWLQALLIASLPHPSM